MLPLFSLTLFVSAFLLFCVQPMIARMVLPLLGGTPAVWTTCMVFFQALLLAGYAYAHIVTSKIQLRIQVLMQSALVLLPAVVLPFGIPADATRSLSATVNPTGWLLLLLLGVVGLPFFVVATSAPLLQRWFSQTGHPKAADPYFLYGASNLGSMLALLAYPFVIEPGLGLTHQRTVWALGYAVLASLMLACAALLWKRHDRPVEPSADLRPADDPERLRIGQVLRWIALAFVPSSLMLGVTTYMTTDIASIPLFWVIPLALYLLTFILTFARRPPLPHRWVVLSFPFAAALLTFLLGIFAGSQTETRDIPFHLACFFLAAMLCHGELVQRRPHSTHLTAFYLAMSFGGVLGGVFNALIAPVVFDRVAEYPIALLLACLLLPGKPAQASRVRPLLLDLLWPAAVGLLAWGVITLLGRSSTLNGDAVLKVTIGAAAFACYTLRNHPLRFALALAAILLVAGMFNGQFERALYQRRGYFGVLRVSYDPASHAHELVNGHTLHGMQSLYPDRRREPLTYYFRTGPIGQVFDKLRGRLDRASLAIVGLGAGTLAAYAQPGQHWDFFDIDPVVERIARDPGLFTYLEDSRASSIKVNLGDARLRLQDAPEHGYTLIVLDAFGSDSIPIHLLTREALRLYLSKLAEGGVIAFHISNRYIDLGPVVGGLARDAGKSCLIQSDREISAEETKQNKFASDWAVVAGRAADLDVLQQDPRWEPPVLRDQESVWTDDYSNLVDHFRMRRD